MERQPHSYLLRPRSLSGERACSFASSEIDLIAADVSADLAYTVQRESRPQLSAAGHAIAARMVTGRLCTGTATEGPNRSTGLNPNKPDEPGGSDRTAAQSRLGDAIPAH